MISFLNIRKGDYVSPMRIFIFKNFFLHLNEEIYSQIERNRITDASCDQDYDNYFGKTVLINKFK